MTHNVVKILEENFSIYYHNLARRVHDIFPHIIMFILKLFLGNVFPYYLRSLPNITVLQSLMDKDLSIACYAKVSNVHPILSLVLCTLISTNYKNTDG